MFIDHRYEVIESLGTGAWANVYKVRDTRSGKYYSLKLFQYLSSKDLYALFPAEEMHHITMIDHPNLSHVVDFGHVGDHIYYISEFFEGNTLNSYKFSRGKLDQVYDLIVQVCYALHALHSQNILHKDLKLENILYGFQNKKLEIKLIDYGFTKIDPDRDSQLISGTLPYIAPEVYLRHQASNASDFYSLGVILYRLCTGTFPFNMDQINALMSGSQQYFIPIFPSELNKDIPLELEKLILRLLEKNPESRFHNGEEVISYVNRTTGRNYPFSVSWSLANSLRLNSYLVREKYSHDLLDKLPHVLESNGKIISLFGGDGLGKDNILSLFRYHILGGEFFIFDYSCNRTDHEAFFALIKEYIQSLPGEEAERINSKLIISEKFRSYLFSKEFRSTSFTQTQEELRNDFEAVKTLLTELCEQKPVIFIIRNFQWVHRHTIEFINFLSNYLLTHRIMVVLGCNDLSKVTQIKHTILMNVRMLDRDESQEYANRLLGQQVPDSFGEWVFQRSAGNPHFIREILFDLIQKKKIWFDTALHFPSSLEDYILPAKVLHSIYARMSHLSAANYAHLQKLSAIYTPLSRDLILKILRIRDEELYSLLTESEHNEILDKHGKLYFFTFAEARKRFFEESSPKVYDLISKRVLRYFKSKTVQDVETCLGIIKSAVLAEDILSERHYYLRLYQLYDDEFDQQRSYEAILQVLKIDFGGKAAVCEADVIRDLNMFYEKTETTGFFRGAEFVLGNADSIPEYFEKYLVLGTLMHLAEDNALALQYFERAAELALTGKQKVMGQLQLAKSYLRVDARKGRAILDMIDPELMNLDLKIAYYDRLAVYCSQDGDYDQAISIQESFLATLPPENDPRVMISLAAMHNDLGVFYSELKNIAEAEEHLTIALTIWQSYNIKRYLGLINNNISDLYLKQGLTVAALEHSELGYQYAHDLDLVLTQALALLNQGEAKIKMGEYQEAEERLLEARKLVLSVNSNKYLDSIQRNLALAKSKIRGFSHYYQFIKEAEPKLIDGMINQINPLVKTFFYYLHEIANVKKLRRLIRKNVQINYQQIHEEEFYHNILSLLAQRGKDYETALAELKLAMKHAGEVNNHYAMAVFNVMQIVCYLGLKDYAKAGELLEAAKPAIQQNRYRYWQSKLNILQMKLDLANSEVPLRKLLRWVIRDLKTCREYQYYQLVVELWQIKIQILLEMAADPSAEAEYQLYREYLEQITDDISDEDRQNYLGVNFHNVKTLKKFEAVHIASRRKDVRNKWNELLYNIANINQVERVKFLIEKGLDGVVSPWQFKLMLFSQRIANFYCFQSFNWDRDSYFPREFSPYIEKAFQSDAVTPFRYNESNVLIVPLVSAGNRIGFLVVSDEGELEFTRNEMAIIRNIKGHLTALMIRMNDYTRITRRIEKMNELMHISYDLMGIVDMPELEREILSTAIDFTNATRGFLIKRDEEGNNLYHMQLDHNKQLLSTTAGISKTALSKCQTHLEPVTTINALEDKTFKNSISVQDYGIHTIFCCPIIVDEVPKIYLYLDNLGESSREMYLNEDIIGLFQRQVGIALKNAAQYEAVLRKSHELNEFESLKDEFMAIVTHELNTPLTALQGYVSRLKRKLYSDEDEKQDIIGKIEGSVKKLILSTGDISTMNFYNLAKNLPKAPFGIDEILDLVQQEVEILSRNRKMFIKMEVEKNLPFINANWEGIHRMVHNIVLNAIRFTNDFGNIVIGARRSVFPTEKINNRESLVIFVQDNGIGIPAYQLKNIFRKFYELNEIYAHKSGTIEYRSSGLGLGLATARRIAQLHGGEITIKSKENEGTTVFIILPFK
jgi:serine/threonine protein kinase/signal transduction histidine kinase